MKTISYFLGLVFLAHLVACDQITQNNSESDSESAAKKAKLIGQVAELGCQDTRDIITKYGAKLIPLVGDVLLDKIISKGGVGDFCECLKPSLESELDAKFEITKLDEMITDRESRRTFVKSAILEKRSEILGCYKEKGSGKGLNFLEKVLDKIAKKQPDVVEN